MIEDRIEGDDWDYENLSSYLYGLTSGLAFVFRFLVKVAIRSKNLGRVQVGA